MNKPLVFLFALLCISFSALAQPNNNCAGAINLTIGTPVTGTVVGSTNDGPISCSGTSRYDVWYTFTPTKGSHTINLTGLGSNFSSPRMQLSAGSCTSASLACGTTSITASGLSTGTLYYIRVFFGGAAGPAPSTNGGFTITVAQPNETCANATTLTPGTVCTALTNQSLFMAEQDAGSPGNTYAGSNPTYDVWYRFTTPAAVTSVRIYLPSRGSAMNDNNTFIEAFNTSSCGSGISATNSIATASKTGGGLTLINLSPNTQYYFRVFTNANPNTNAGTWTYSICITYEGAPGNDECGSATSLTMGPNNILNGQRLNNATASSGIPIGTATDTPDDDVWFRFTATATTAKVNILHSSPLAAAGVSSQIFSGSCGSLTPLGWGTRGSSFASGLSVGTQYYVRVYTGGATGVNPSGGLYGGNINNAGFSIAVTAPTTAVQIAGRMNEVFKQTILSAGNLLLDPWDITVGPDGYLWITEAKGYRLYRMNPTTGERSTVLDLNASSNFFTSATDRAFNVQWDPASQSGQGGFAGLAIHPNLGAAVDQDNSVFVSYIYDFRYQAPNKEGKFFTNRVVKFTYNPATNRLESPVSICDTIPGSSDHNSQRMIIAPVDNVNYLFYAAGDMGAGQFENQTRPQKAQDSSAYEGKILRFNLTPDGDAGLDKWIPNDNPYNTTSPAKQNAVWVVGIRNNQGFAYDPDLKKLYGASHGPYSDDEINVIEGHRNYGHPIVIGKKDDANYDGSSAGAYPTSSCPVIGSELYNADVVIGAAYKDPFFTAYPRTKSYINGIWVTNPDNLGWPSEGWSGIDIYKSTYAPGWKNSLIVASLKWGRVLRFKIDATGESYLPVGGYDTIANFDSRNRFRDVAFSHDGKDMFLIMDRNSATSVPSANNPSIVDCPGCVQKFTFLGYWDVGGKSSIDSTVDVTAPVSNNICTPATTVTINSDNNNLWVPITGPDGNILAEIYPNGQNLGEITSSFYKNSNALRQRNGKYYLDRNITITPAIQPSSPVKIRLYISRAEFDALASQTLVDTITQISILKNNDNCRPTLGSNTIAVSTTPYRHGPNGYVLQGEISSFSTFYFGASLITLPLELMTFKGALVNNTTVLDWETNNEKNTDKYVIERSTDNRTFEDIGTVAAAGNSTSRLFYNFVDPTVNTLSSSVIYYRLRMIGIDGNYDYSNTIKITLNDLIGRLTVFPNPASSDIKMSVTAAKAGEVKWKIVNSAGAVVLQSITKLKAGKNVIPVSVAKLAAGIYHISMSGPGIDENVKFQKL